MTLLVRIKRKLTEEPLESVVLGRQANPKRANVDDLRHALKETSLNPQVFRLLSTTSDATLLPSNILDTIAEKKKTELGTKFRRSSARKPPKSFEPSGTERLVAGQLEQSKSQRHARMWNCRKVKVHGFNVLEFSGDDPAQESADALEDFRRGQPVRRDVVTAGRLRDLEQEAKARTVDSKTLRRARGWRQWQQQNRPQPVAPPAADPAEASVPVHYMEMLKEFHADDDRKAPGNFFDVPLCPTSSSTSSKLDNSSDLHGSVSETSATIDFKSSSAERDYVWDLYYCCGSEMDPDLNAVELLYESEVSDDESEDSNGKEYDYSEEESSDEGDYESDDTADDSEGVLNKRMSRWKDDEEESEDEEDD